MEPFTLLSTAISGLVGALLTYLATRKGHEIDERTLYLGAVERLTGSLRGDIERLEAERRGLLQRIEQLEACLREERQKNAVFHRSAPRPEDLSA